MGLVEDKIKEKVLQEIYSDVSNIYDFIENRFSLDEKQKENVINKLNSLNNDLTIILKEASLL